MDTTDVLSGSGVHEICGTTPGGCATCPRAVAAVIANSKAETLKRMHVRIASDLIPPWTMIPPLGSRRRVANRPLASYGCAAAERAPHPLRNKRGLDVSNSVTRTIAFAGFLVGVFFLRCWSTYYTNQWVEEARESSKPT